MVQIVMEYCGGGSVNDIVQITGGGLTEDTISLICRETLKVQRHQATPICNVVTRVCITFILVSKFIVISKGATYC